MRLYNVKNEYVEFLHRFDSTVLINKDERRPYVGVVLEIEGLKYYAPLTSPKEKYLTMKNAPDFRKIKNGELGAINFNNMIPVPESALIEFDISDVRDEKYRYLLYSQINAINRDKKMICQKAHHLHDVLTADETTLSAYEKKIKQRCCNIRLLESVFSRYRCEHERTRNSYER